MNGPKFFTSNSQHGLRDAEFVEPSGRRAPLDAASEQRARAVADRREVDGPAGPSTFL
jgi:hypothetical protein